MKKTIFIIILFFFACSQEQSKFYDLDGRAQIEIVNLTKLWDGFTIKIEPTEHNGDREQLVFFVISPNKILIDELDNRGIFDEEIIFRYVSNLNASQLKCTKNISDLLECVGGEDDIYSEHFTLQNMDNKYFYIIHKDPIDGYLIIDLLKTLR